MPRNLTTRSLILAVAILGTAACQKTSPSPLAQTPPAAPAASSPEATPQAAPPAAAPAATTPPVQVCSLLSAAEVSAVMGKPLIQDGCTYGLDPAAKEKALAETQKQLQESSRRAQSGDLSGFTKGMMQVGAGSQKMQSTMMEQMTVSVDAVRDDQTEQQVKEIYAKTGKQVRGAIAPLQPENRGLNGLIEGLDEVSGVGDWAFATNVAAVNLGMMSARGRILEARKGPWHVTVSATVGPDPGAAALDNRLAGVARALIAKL